MYTKVFWMMMTAVQCNGIMLIHMMHMIHMYMTLLYDPCPSPIFEIQGSTIASSVFAKYGFGHRSLDSIPHDFKARMQ
jgi:hypothetical protein